MDMLNDQINYEEDLDLLYLSKNKSNEKIIGTLVFGNIVFDVSTEGKIVGVEIDCASKIFNLNPKQLSNLKNARLIVNITRNLLTLGVFISINSIERTYQLAIPSKKISLTC